MPQASRPGPPKGVSMLPLPAHAPVHVDSRTRGPGPAGARGRTGPGPVLWGPRPEPGSGLDSDRLGWAESGPRHRAGRRAEPALRALPVCPVRCAALGVCQRRGPAPRADLSTVSGRRGAPDSDSMIPGVAVSDSGLNISTRARWVVCPLGRTRGHGRRVREYRKVDSM